LSQTELLLLNFQYCPVKFIYVELKLLYSKGIGEFLNFSI